jgi:hypothetical protein
MLFDLPHPKKLHFFSSLFFFSSPLVQVLGLQRHTGRFKTKMVNAYQVAQSFLQSFGTHPFTGSLFHQAVNHSRAMPFFGGSIGRLSVEPQSGRHQSDSQHSVGQTSVLKPEAFGQQVLHHSFSRHCAGGNSGTSRTSLNAKSSHHLFSMHFGQTLPNAPVSTGVPKTLDVVEVGNIGTRVPKILDVADCETTVLAVFESWGLEDAKTVEVTALEVRDPEDVTPDKVPVPDSVGDDEVPAVLEAGASLVL